MRHLGLTAALLILTGGLAEAETVLERARRDGIAMVEKDDADMAAAMRKARERLPEFLKLARTPQPTMRAFAGRLGSPRATISSSSGLPRSCNARTSSRAGSTTCPDWSRR